MVKNKIKHVIYVSLKLVILLYILSFVDGNENMIIQINEGSQTLYQIINQIKKLYIEIYVGKVGSQVPISYIVGHNIISLCKNNIFLNFKNHILDDKFGIVS